MKLFYKSFYGNYAQDDDQVEDVYVFMRNLKIQKNLCRFRYFTSVYKNTNLRKYSLV